MRGTHPVLPRRSFALALAIALCACGKKRDAGRIAPAPAKPEAALTDAVSGGAAEAPPAAADAVPAWAKESPRFFMRNGLRFASAVGSARIRNAGLARAAAEDRARVDLIRLIREGAPDEAAEVSLPGAHPTDIFTSKKDGQVFVRLEIPTAPG